jgi:hypothetical protein
MKLEINKRTEAILTEIRDHWFPKEQEPMNLEEFVYILACSVFYNTIKIKRGKEGKKWIRILKRS